MTNNIHQIQTACFFRCAHEAEPSLPFFLISVQNSSIDMSIQVTLFSNHNSREVALLLCNRNKTLT